MAKKRGAPKVLTPAKIKAILEFIEAGGSRKKAAEMVGVRVSTIAHEAERNPDFLDRLTHAEAECYRKQIEKVAEADDWRAASWFLARKWPEEFSEVKTTVIQDARSSSERILGLLERINANRAGGTGSSGGESAGGNGERHNGNGHHNGNGNGKH